MENTMKSKTWVVATAAPLVLSIMASSGQAAPIGDVGKHVRAAAAASLVDRISSRCWREHGRRHCKWYGGPEAYQYRNGDSTYYVHDADRLPFGSQRWWDQMLRENRLNPGGGRG
jgi:hypothetical protein